MEQKNFDSQFDVKKIDSSAKPYEKLTIKNGDVYNGWGNTIYEGKPENIYTSEKVIEDWFTRPIRSMARPEGEALKIADFGGAAGATVGVIQKQMGHENVEPYNVDINKDAVNRGKELNENINHVVASLALLPFNDNFFDAGCSRSVIQYNPLDSEKFKTQGEVIKEIHRVLKPGGIFVMTWPGAKSKEMFPILNQASAKIEAYIMGVPEENILDQKCYTDPESLRELAEAAGFRVVESKVLLELPTTIEAYYDRFGEIIKQHDGNLDGLSKVYNEVIEKYGSSLSTAEINDKTVLTWSEHRLILEK
jgi:SAM-dependent methyltransferase